MYGKGLAPQGEKPMETVPLIIMGVVILTLFVLGGVNFKAKRVKVYNIEIQEVELNVLGVIPRSK